MLDVLKDPNDFFRKKINDDIDWKPPLMIMATMAIIGAISAYIATMQIMGAMPEEIASFALIGAVFGVVGAVVGVFFAWIIYSAVFYVISLILNGEGDFKRVMEFVSYGFIPSIFGSVINLYFTYTVLSDIDLSKVDPTLIADIMVADPTMKIAGVLGIIFTLWSANIWLFGLVYSRNLSLKNAAIVVGIPVGIYVLYTLYNLKIFGA